MSHEWKSLDLTRVNWLWTSYLLGLPRRVSVRVEHDGSCHVLFSWPFITDNHLDSQPSFLSTIDNPYKPHHLSTTSDFVCHCSPMWQPRIRLVWFGWCDPQCCYSNDHCLMNACVQLVSVSQCHKSSTGILHDMKMIFTAHKLEPYAICCSFRGYGDWIQQSIRHNQSIVVLYMSTSNSIVSLSSQFPGNVNSHWISSNECSSNETI